MWRYINESVNLELTIHSIDSFTSIGLGALTEEMREFLKVRGGDLEHLLAFCC
jgi:hypothetical protein